MKSIPSLFRLLGLATCISVAVLPVKAQAPATSVAGYSSIQEAIDRNPGKPVFVPAGDHPISEAIRITVPGSGLWGPGRIVQANPAASILELKGASGAQIRAVTLTRAPGKLDSTREGIAAEDCTDLVIDGVRVIDNRSQQPAIRVTGCRRAQVRNCVIENYTRVGIDDRTRSPDWNFAFRVIDGTGLGVRDSIGAQIANNRIIENVYKPTEAIKKQFGLGDFSKMNATRGDLVSEKMWAEKYYNAWHQGSALHVSAPESGECYQIIGNYIENAAQGMDIHADHVIVANNIVNNAFIGMKAMHGSRNVIIIGNQFSRNDLWAIGLMPGASSHPADDPQAQTPGANVDGYSIIANNIISDFGYGNAYWMWQSGTMSRYAIRLDKGQKAMNPPLQDVIIKGNVVMDTGRDGILIDGKPQVVPPRYTYAVHVAPTDASGRQGPVGMHFRDNLFHPGTDGISNVDLSP